MMRVPSGIKKSAKVVEIVLSQVMISSTIVFFFSSLSYALSKTSLTAHLYIASICEVIGDTFLVFVSQR